MIIFMEETVLRFLPAAVAAQFHKNGCFEPFLWNSAIVTMRISTGAPRHSRGRRKVLDNFVQKPFTGTKPQALPFKACGFVPYALKRAMALRSAGAHKTAGFRSPRQVWDSGLPICCTYTKT